MEFGPGVTVFITGMAILAIAMGARWFDGRKWRRELTALRVRLPDGLTLDEVSRALSVVAGSTRRKPIAFEIAATARGITHHILAPEHLTPRIITMMTTVLPGVRIEEDPDYLAARPAVKRARELRCARTLRPLSVERGVAAIAGVLSMLYPLGSGEVVRIQWIFCSTTHFRLVGEFPGHVRRDFRQKQSTPLVNACGRVAVSATHRGRAALLMGGVLTGMDVLNGPGVALCQRLIPIPTRVVARRVYARSLPLMRWPCLFNTDEAACLIGFPVDGLAVPGLAVGGARALPVPEEMRNSNGLVVGASNFPGMAGRLLILENEDRLRHILIQAPTGAGKSNLLGSLAIQDIQAGHGVIVIDPKADLIASILSRIPRERVDDVIVMDASATDRSVGFNLLQSHTARGEHARELVVDRAVHIFSQLWRQGWGPRTADVMRNSLLTLVETRAADKSAFTLAELPDLLLDADFRGMVTRQALPEGVRQFWDAYEELSDNERAQVIGPTLNKVRSFTTRTALRLMLGQSAGLDLGEVFRKGKILLVPLSEGTIGPDAAHLLGSLLVASIWQETQARAAIPEHKRRPVFCYVDEFQQFVRFGGGSDIADMLAQARSYKLGLTLAYQYLDQLPPEVEAAVLGTVRTQLVFALEYRDADIMAKRFAPLDRADLTGLDAYEIAMRPCVNSRTLHPVTGRTTPLSEPLYDAADLAAYSLSGYGSPREQIDVARQARLHITPALEAGTGEASGRQPLEHGEA